MSSGTCRRNCRCRTTRRASTIGCASAGGDLKEVFGRFGWYGYYKFGGYIASLYGPPDERARRSTS